MTTLDDKLLGEKLHYYCSSDSSSDDESESNEEKLTEVDEKETTNIPQWNRLSHNTGPKGVIEDWQKYKQLQREQREEDEKKRLQLCEKLSLVCPANEETEKEDDSEKFLLEYRKQRMQEMMSQYSNKNSCFGIVINIKSPSDFLKMIDEEDKNTTVIVHVYDNTVTACKNINQFLNILAEQYKDVKFCKILTTTAGLSLHFKLSGVPAFLVYKDKQIIGNFIRLTDEFGDDFCESDIENFLIENGILGNKIFSSVGDFKSVDH
ncbi:hypothetical protein PGB90_007262 [Kerria lacca]